ncbi:MAG: hypothetical protein HKO66_16755 [Saprospiraceae bacterium]|nr:hypothetical protein [Bacteroidia bacterium]NNE13322.1 hypothetical protein [Saprospiraceae bacterium]NNL93897.1 hypothetical protein [Saprospiraceae bacterium]
MNNKQEKIESFMTNEAGINEDKNVLNEHSNWKKKIDKIENKYSKTYWKNISRTSTL